MSLNDKIALVTGASRGIGFEVAQAIASKGAMVIGTATSQGSAEKFENEIKNKGFKAKGLVLNFFLIINIFNLFFIFLYSLFINFFSQ